MIAEMHPRHVLPPASFGGGGLEPISGEQSIYVLVLVLDDGAITGITAQARGRQVRTEIPVRCKLVVRAERKARR